MNEKDKSRYLGDVEYFSAKLEQDPSSLLFVPLAKAYLKLEKYDEAVQVLTAGIDANSDIVSAKTMLAKAYLGLAKIDDAKALLTEVQVIDKSNYLAAKLMGDIHRSEDDLKKALVSYRSALVIAPEDLELKNLVEELMSAAGIAAHELEEEFSLMDADDEMLDKLGSELADEVRQEVGVAELGREEASEDQVSKTVDDIVGGKAMGEEDEGEMSLDSFEEDGVFGEELEEELVASFDDDIVPTDLSTDSQQPSVFLDKEIMESGEGEDAPDEDDVRALAAELGADLGLEPGAEPVSVPDEIDEALDKVMEPEEGEVDGMGFFTGASDEPEDVDEAALLQELSGAAPEQEPVDEVAEALAEIAGEEKDEAGDVDEVAAAMAELEAEQSNPSDVDEVAAAMAELEAEQAGTGAGSEEQGFFEGASDEPDEFDETALLQELNGTASEQEEPVDEVAEALAEIAGEASETTVEIDDVAAAMAELEAEQTEPSASDDVAAAMAELEAEQTEADASEEDTAESFVDEAVKEQEEVAEASNFDQLQDMLEGALAVSEEYEENGAESTAETSDIPGEDPSEIYEASMEELMQEGPEEDEDAAEDDENLPPETREQVNRLENLLEIIKNNSSS